MKSHQTPRGARRFDSIDDFENWLDRMAAGRFSRRRAYQGGNWAALYDAVQAAITRDDPPDDETATVAIPAWAALAIVDDVLPAFLCTVPPRRKTDRRRGGRPPRWTSEWRRDHVDFKRFEEVWCRRIARRDHHQTAPKPKEARQERRAYQQHAERKGSSYVVDMFTPYPWNAGQSDDDWSVFEAVSRVYGETKPYGGSARAMKKSWERVTAALERGESWRYYPSRWLRIHVGQTRSIDEEQAR
jgi:hypothetical protein